MALVRKESNPSTSYRGKKRKILEFQDLVLINTRTVNQALVCIQCHAAPLQDLDSPGVCDCTCIVLDTIEEAKRWIEERSDSEYLSVVATIGDKRPYKYSPGGVETIRYQTLYLKNHK